MSTDIEKECAACAASFGDAWGRQSAAHQAAILAGWLAAKRATRPAPIPAQMVLGAAAQMAPNSAEIRMDTGFGGAGQVARNALTDEAKDAARYRWLRTKNWMHEICFRDPEHGIPFAFVAKTGRELDKATDAAIASHIKAGQAGKDGGE
jgi:hypothetical protein